MRGQSRNYNPPQRPVQEAQNWQQRNGWQSGGGWRGQSNWQATRSNNWGSEHRTWSQRGGYGGYFIPAAAFGLTFGFGNYFHIRSQPYIVGGYPRFQYGGYTFMMVDPWPSEWDPNWYASDDLYIDYNDGYYLYNRTYPYEAVAVVVVR